MRIISWNVNGMRASVKKGMEESVKLAKADILCCQEVKARQEEVSMKIPDLPHVYWSCASRPGYAGTAVFSSEESIETSSGGEISEHDSEGRVITLSFKDFYLVNVYVPNSGRGLPRLNYREQWDKDFLSYLKKLEKKKPVVACGDFNVAHKAIDLKNPKSNWNKTAGYTEIECRGFDNLLAAGFIDAFRLLHPDEPGHYTWWSYRFNARERNIGWRIDYFLISSSLKSKLKDAFILPEMQGSDHCPVGIRIEVSKTTSEIH